MQEAFESAVADVVSALRLLHREGKHAGALGAARRAPAGNGTKRRVSCAQPGICNILASRAEKT
jgi:hypothetical protein